jgi:acyl carrier protein
MNTADVQARLVMMMKQVSGYDAATGEPGRFDASANFFELGFDSLSIVEMAQRAQAEFGVPVGFRLLLEHPNAIELGAAIDSLLAIKDRERG